MRVDEVDAARDAAEAEARLTGRLAEVPKKARRWVFCEGPKGGLHTADFMTPDGLPLCEECLLTAFQESLEG